MRGSTKTLLWFAILLACAGVGAGVAYLFPPDPFPPGVRDPGPQASPGPDETRGTSWSLLLMSRTTHRYRVGGSCTSDWRMRARIRVGSGGEVRGDGSATLRPGAGCDFPSAQVQADGVRLAILGVREGDALRLRFRVREVEPPGAQDLGGFVRLVPRLTITIEERDGAEVERPGRLEPPDGEIYAAVTRIRLAARRS